MHNKIAFFVLYLFLGLTLQGQEEITVEDIWTNYKYASKSVPGFNFMADGQHYSRLEKDIIKKYDLLTGAYVTDILDAKEIKGKLGFEGKISSYYFNNDESKIIIKSESESIYRRSSKAEFHIYDRKSKKLQAVLEDTKVSYATLSPDNTKIAYVWENNLYYMDLASGETLAASLDGKYNEVINGAADWVYEEEFAFAKAFFWSPDSKSIAYIRFDESKVKEFTMTKHNDNLYPEYVRFKYPKVGEVNASVSVHIYKLEGAKTIEVDLEDMNDMYIPRIKWTKEENKLCIFKMNRHQNDLKLLLANAKDGTTNLLLHEKNKFYIDITDDLNFLEDKKHFIWSSEKSGYNHLYLYDMTGKEKTQLTNGSYDVTSFYGVDTQNSKIFYQAADENPLQRNIYSLDLDGKNKFKLNYDKGYNRAQFSSTYDYYVLNHSKLNEAPSYEVFDRKNQSIRLIEDNKNIKTLQQNCGVTPISFFEFEARDKTKLNGWMIKPKGFDATKKYPVFMYLYGGPGSQQVTDSWKGMNYWWFQSLAQQGYIVACIDNRGTGARGEKFKKSTYLQLGKYETMDQIDAATYLGSQNYVDEKRIGIFGWSYGGYMSTLCLLKGNDIFKAAIAVAPVTSWKWYDTIYTERYMRTLAENEAGYIDNSPIYFADKLKGNYLLVHGMADDNVHFQHSAEMAKALIKANKQFDTYFYTNRNHGIYGDNARAHLYEKMTNFVLEKI